MVEFIYGVPGSGKTSYIMSRLASDVRVGRRAFVIVPEQQTVEVERAVADRLPPQAQLSVEALNFSRLANRIFRERGGLVYNYADKSRKLLFMWRALRECAPMLSEYGGRAASDASLSSAMLQSVREFKACGITPKKLAEASRRFSSGRSSDRALGGKLGDLSLIYAAYSALLSQNFTDSDDDLSRLAEKLADEPYFGGSSVYIDSFSSFTGQEHEIIKLIMRQADEVVITLPLSSPADRALCSFSSRKCSDRLRRDASGLGIKPALISLDGNRRPGNAELRVVCAQFRDQSVSADIPENERGHVRLFSLSDPYSECDAAAAEVKSLLMEGYRCRDIAVIARDAEKYRGIIDSAFEKLSIPCFLSEKTGFSTRPLARLILSALRIKMYGWRREDVTAHIKTGLCGIAPRDADIFEAYAEKWNISGRAFYGSEAWNKNPDGYTPRLTERGKDILARANAVRTVLRDRLTAFFAAIDAAADTAGICRAIWEYLESLDVRGTLRALAVRDLSEGRRREAEEDGKLYDSAADALECLCDVFNEKPDIATFASALRLAFDSAEIGTIPTGCDEVVIGSADMLRAGDRKCAVLIGLDEGEFPGSGARGGLLTDRDRTLLAEAELELSVNAEAESSDELFFLLRAVSVPSEKLLLFTHETDAGGSACRPSSAFLRVAALLPYINIKTENDISPADRIWSRRTAYEYLAMYEGTPTGDALAACLENDPGYASARSRAVAPLTARRETIAPALARTAFGERIELTQSRIESFVSCPYNYYLKYVLRLDDGARAEFNYAGMGSFVHRVLEKFLLSVAADSGFDSAPDSEKASSLLDGIIGEYTASLGITETSPRLSHLISRLRGLTELLLSDIFAEFSAGSFRPEAFELPIGIDVGRRGIPAPEFPLRDGGCAVLRGIADRVDTARESDGSRLLRVVDYKTGSKDFSLEDVKNGLELQLPIYLYALTHGEAAGEGSVPAAITYLSANVPPVKLERPLTGDEIRREARRSIKRSGLVLDNDEVLNALNSERDPHFMQGAKYSRDGTPSPALVSQDGMRELFSELERTVEKIASSMRSGRACALPFTGSDGRCLCDNCRYAAVCRTPSRKAE